MSPLPLLILGDGRFPSGGHAHSGGAEAAVAAGRVHDAASLEAFCLGRLATSGLVAASLAAADARTPSPALRQAARKLGRQLMRAVRAVWPGPELEHLAAARPAGAHQPVVLGLAARSAGLTPRGAAQAAAYDSVCAPVTAVIRLLGLDPFAATAVTARLGGAMESVAAEAADHAARLPADGVDALPAASAPLLDITAEQHAAWPVRLFAS